jgi:outer membrane lipoprotein SlyB
MAGALTALGRTDDVARLATARGQYRNYLAIEQAANSAGEAAAYGTISPAALRAAVKAQGLRGYATGTRGDIADLARAAQGILQRPNTSGTAENLSAMGVPISTGATLGAVVGSALGGVPGAAVGTLAGSAAPYFVRGLQASRPGQAYLANQMMTPNALMIQRSGIPLLPLSTGDNALAYQ